ncbi:MAG: hypothetical protein U0230_20630 [Polyangiales bacterium]
MLPAILVGLGVAALVSTVASAFEEAEKERVETRRSNLRAREVSIRRDLAARAEASKDRARAAARRQAHIEVEQLLTIARKSLEELDRDLEAARADQHALVAERIRPISRRASTESGHSARRTRRQQLEQALSDIDVRVGALAERRVATENDVRKYERRLRELEAIDV